MKQNFFTESRQTLWLALPFIANQLLQMSVITIDSLMAGADSELTLAAVAQGTILWHLVMLGMIGVLLPLTAAVARAHSRGDKAQIHELFQQSLWLALLLGIIGFALLWWIPAVMQWIDVDEAIIPPATAYLRIICFAMPFVALFFPIRFTTEGMGNPKAMMLLTATSLPINIIGNYVLINGLWGLPKMGASGIALATLLAEIYLLCAGCWFVLKNKRMRPLRFLTHLTPPQLRPIMRLLHLGIPSALALLMESGMFTAVILLSGRLGVDAAAANQIAFNYISNIFAVPLGVSMALTTRIGMAMGENNLGKARMIGISGMSLGAGIMLLSALGIAIFGGHIAQWYTDDNNVIVIATRLLALAGLFQVFDGVQVCGSGALRGLEETHAPMRYAALGYWLIGVPLAVVLTFPLGLGAVGLWWGLVFGLSTTAILCARQFLRLTAVKPAQNAQV